MALCMGGHYTGCWLVAPIKKAKDGTNWSRRDAGWGAGAGYGSRIPSASSSSDSHTGLLPMTHAGIDFERLLKLRLLVARFGEMDNAKWWNTKSQLGRLGTLALRRGFPRTHRFAQARAVFAVAARRCSEVFDPPDGVTLWRLPEAIEQEFEAQWEQWLDHAGDWGPFFQQLESVTMAVDLVATLRAFAVVGDANVAAYSRLRRAAEGRTVPISNPFTASNDAIALLALGFARGEEAALAVPYAPKADA
jgi:hypothetical protein